MQQRQRRFRRNSIHLNSGIKPIGGYIQPVLGPVVVSLNTSTDPVKVGLTISGDDKMLLKVYLDPFIQLF